jgi:uncharacterized protein YndB with AHSA1/START domain
VSTVQVDISIKAPVERVWETVMDPYHLKDWVTIHRSLRDHPSLPLRKGSEMEQVLQLHGIPFHVHWTLEEVRPPTRAQWEGRGPAHSAALIRYDLSSEGDSCTRFEYTNEFQPPGGRLGIVASRVIVGAASEREAHNSLTRLKALIESNS